MNFMKYLVWALAMVIVLGQTYNTTLQDTPDLFVPVSSSLSSEAQRGNQIINSLDKNYSTLYHSRWNRPTVFPVYLNYTFTNVDYIDYVTIVPRQSGSNGFFGLVQIYVKTSSSAAEYLYGAYDFKMVSTVRTIYFTGLTQPTLVSFKVLTGFASFVSCAEISFFKIANSYPQNLVNIPLGGNSYLTAGSVGYVQDSGLAGWTSSSSIFSTYFRVNTAGSLNLYINASVIASSTIKVSLAGVSNQVNLVPRLVQPIGAIQNCPVGYLRVDFQGISKVGTHFAFPFAIMASGTASVGMTYVGDFSFYWGRRGPSVHLQHKLPLTSGVYARWFYNQLTVPPGSDVIGSYYMSNGFNEGYFGMQVNSATERRILFSVWSAYSTDDPKQIPAEYQVQLLQAGAGVIAKNFGGEGSGGQSYWLYNWTVGNTYKFLTKAVPNAATNSTEFASYFLAPEMTQWKLIARWLRPKTISNYSGAYSFLQNFDNKQGYLERSVNIGNQWIYTTTGQWLQVTKVQFTYDGTASAGARKDYAGGLNANGDKFYLRNCGFFNTSTTYGTNFTRPATGTPPSISFVS